MTEYLKLLKKCQRCRSSQSCSLVCVNRDCSEEYGQLICMKCHEKNHRKGENVTVKVDELIGDFDAFLKEGVRKGMEVQKLNTQVKQNIDTIDGVIAQLEEMRQEMLHLSHLCAQHNHIQHTFNALKTKKNFDLINASTQQLLNSCIYQINQHPRIQLIQNISPLQSNSTILNNSTFPQLAKQCLVINKRLQKIQQIQNLTETEIIQEEITTNHNSSDCQEDVLNLQSTLNNSLISDIKFKSSPFRIEDYTDMSELLEKIEEIKMTSLKEINEKLRVKGCPYKWDEFNNIDMHLSSRNVPDFINCTITDNGFDYLWCRGGYWSARKTHSTHYGFLDIVEYWIQQKQIIQKLKTKLQSD